MEHPTIRAKILRECARRGVVTIPDLVALGASRGYIENLVEQGDLNRIGRGLFQLPDFDATENHSIVQVAAYAPTVVICLLTALRFHDLTTQLPPYVWIALPNHRPAPRVPTVGIEVVHMNDAWLKTDVVSHMLEGVDVSVFSPAKTIVDCFRYRGRVTTSVAIEALRDGLKQRKATHEQLYTLAKKGRVWSVMRPYMEAIS